LTDVILYYAGHNTWQITRETWVDEGTDLCYIRGRARTGTMSPLDIRHWQVYKQGMWGDVKATCEELTGEELKTAKKTYDATQVSGVVFKGLKGEHSQSTLNGAYVRVHKTVNGWPVYACTTPPSLNSDIVLFRSREGSWRIARQKWMDEGTDLCYVLGKPKSGTMSPVDVVQWQVYDQKWHDV